MKHRNTVAGWAIVALLIQAGCLGATDPRVLGEGNDASCTDPASCPPPSIDAGVEAHPDAGGDVNLDAGPSADTSAVTAVDAIAESSPSTVTPYRDAVSEEAGVNADAPSTSTPDVSLDASPEAGAPEASPDVVASCSVQAVAAGNDFTCALTTAGGVRCWGSNVYGQLGDGTTVNRATPASSDVLTGAKAITAGTQHACALLTTGGVKCWGNNTYNQLGDGSTVEHHSPVDVISNGAPLAGVTAVAAGYQHTCVLTTDRNMRCWGLNINAQLGDGTMSNVSSVPNVAVVANADGIFPSLGHTCALTQGSARCWGLNDTGQVGDGTTTRRLTPVNVVTPTGPLTGIAAMGVGGYHSCAVMAATRALRCWGNNTEGELGDGTTTIRTTAPDVDGLAGVQSVAGGAYHTCALTMSGGVRCWGLNSGGQLGDGTTLTRTAVGGTDVLTGVRALAAGSFHTCALIASGLRCWGTNTAGQLGDGTMTNRLSPPLVDLNVCP